MGGVRKECSENVAHIPFSANATVTISIKGDLDDIPEVHEALRIVFRDAGRFKNIRIEAGEARIVPEGINAWINYVGIFLSTSKLTYAPSQLAMILQYDDRYEHFDTVFEE